MNEIEKQIFINMFIGEEIRDASSSIRGFLFQELVAINELLNDDTTCVCLEYVEDVFVVATKEVRYIQVKYYPNSVPKMPNIMRDLYYQFLKLQLSGYEGNVKPMLCVHTPNQSEKPHFSKLKEFIDVDMIQKPSAVDDFSQWLKEKTCQLENKQDIQKQTFMRFAWNESMKEFWDNLEVDMKVKSLGEYRKSIVERISQLSFVKQISMNKDIKENVILGLAVQYVQESYNEEKNTFDERKCERRAFLEYLEEGLCAETEEQVAAYLRSIVIKLYETIEKNNPSLSQEQINILQCICDNSARWIYSIGITPEGQLQLLNTVSREPANAFIDFTLCSISERLQCVHEHKDCIMVFLRYLWKIVFNLVQEINEEDRVKKRKILFSPETYFDRTEKRYLKSVFGGDEAESSIILSGLTNGSPWESLRNILDRMKRIKPEKWYLTNGLFCDNCKKLHGKYDYDLDVGKIKSGDKKSVAMISEDYFRIECMDCIKIDIDEWEKVEKCKDTIFTNDCIKEKENDLARLF